MQARGDREDGEVVRSGASESLAVFWWAMGHAGGIKIKLKCFCPLLKICFSFFCLKVAVTP